MVLGNTSRGIEKIQGVETTTLVSALEKAKQEGKEELKRFVETMELSTIQGLVDFLALESYEKTSESEKKKYMDILTSFVGVLFAHEVVIPLFQSNYNKTINGKPGFEFELDILLGGQQIDSAEKFLRQLQSSEGMSPNTYLIINQLLENPVILNEIEHDYQEIVETVRANDDAIFDIEKQKRSQESSLTGIRSNAKSRWTNLTSSQKTSYGLVGGISLVSLLLLGGSLRSNKEKKEDNETQSWFGGVPRWGRVGLLGGGLLLGGQAWSYAANNLDLNSATETNSSLSEAGQRMQQTMAEIIEADRRNPIPYKWGDESIYGADCSGLLRMAVSKSFGESVDPYGMDINNRAARTFFEKGTERFKLDNSGISKLVEGDLICWDATKNRKWRNGEDMVASNIDGEHYIYHVARVKKVQGNTVTIIESTRNHGVQERTASLNSLASNQYREPELYGVRMDRSAFS